MDRLTRCLLEEATRTATKIVEAMPEEVWRQQPEGRFGPGEQLVHMAQSEQFALRIILPVGGIGPSFVLGSPFKEVVAIPDLQERHQALSRLNLQGARQGLGKFTSLDQLRTWWKDKRRDAIRALEQIPDVDQIWWTELQHPLVPNLRRPLIVMLHILFTAHPFYHSGQTTSLLKELGHGNVVPFPFGEFVPIAM